MVLTYVDDCILISKDASVIDEFITSLTNGPDKYVFTDEGTMNTYLGANISPLPNKEDVVLSQPHLIERIIEALDFDPKRTKGTCGDMPDRTEKLPGSNGLVLECLGMCKARLVLI